MALPKNKDFNDYRAYMTDPNPTTSAQAQDFFENQNMLTGEMIKAYWQPETEYAEGDVVQSSSMPANVEAVCVSVTGGKTSNEEPEWGNVGGGNIPDGTCMWSLRYKHWTKQKATQAEAEAGTSDAKVMTPLRVWDAIRKWFSNNKATQVEAEAGTSDTKVMTPLRVMDAMKKYVASVIATLLATAVFTAVAKTVAPASNSNDNSIPTTSWVRNFVNSVVLDLIFDDYLLAQNGYVKFRIGLILQWGRREIASSGTLTFPISFTLLPTFLRCNQSVADGGLLASGGGYSQLTKASVYLLADSGIPVQSWIAVGF